MTFVQRGSTDSADEGEEERTKGQRGSRMMGNSILTSINHVSGGQSGMFDVTRCGEKAEGADETEELPHGDQALTLE